jgi:hypothetical protein
VNLKYIIIINNYKVHRIGSGVFGHFGSFVNCNSQDNSMYCNFVKFFNVLIMLMVIIGIIYFIYKFASPYFMKKK